MLLVKLNTMAEHIRRMLLMKTYGIGIGVLPGLSVKGFHTGDLSNEFPTEGNPYIGNMAKPITGSCSGNIHFSEFMTNLAKFLHKYDKYNWWSSNDIIDKTEKLITKYGYGADDCREIWTKILGQQRCP